MVKIPVRSNKKATNNEKELKALNDNLKLNAKLTKEQLDSQADLINSLKAATKAQEKAKTKDTNKKEKLEDKKSSSKNKEFDEFATAFAKALKPMLKQNAAPKSSKSSNYKPKSSKSNLGTNIGKPIRGTYNAAQNLLFNKNQGSFISYGISALSGGAINPVLISGLGIDRFIQATAGKAMDLLEGTVNLGWKATKKATAFAARNYYDLMQTTAKDIYSRVRKKGEASDEGGSGEDKDNNITSENTKTRSKTSGKSSSAVDSPTLRQIYTSVSNIETYLTGKKKDLEKKEEPAKKKRGLAENLGLGVAAFGLMSLVRDFAEDGLSGILQNFGMSKGTAAMVANLTMDALQGGITGYILTGFNPIGALVGALILPIIKNKDAIFESFVKYKPIATDKIKEIAGLTLEKFDEYIAAFKRHGIIGVGLALAMDKIFGSDEKEDKTVDRYKVDKNLTLTENLKRNDEYLKAIDNAKKQELAKKQREENTAFAKDQLNKIEKNLANYTPIPTNPNEQTIIDEAIPLQDGSSSPQEVALNQSFYTNNKNVPEEAMNNLNKVRSGVVNPLQQALLEDFGEDAKLTMTSSYRNPEYNARTKGAAKNSKHLTGKAVDLQANGISPAELVETLKKHNIPFSKAIIERDGGKEWLHVEYDENAHGAQEVASLVNGRYQQIKAPLETSNVKSAAERSAQQTADIANMKNQELSTKQAVNDMDIPLMGSSASSPSSTPITNNYFYGGNGGDGSSSGGDINSASLIYPFGDVAQTLYT